MWGWTDFGKACTSVDADGDIDSAFWALRSSTIDLISLKKHNLSLALGKDAARGEVDGMT